ncbi:hypothetical protein [Rhizohabitans arisaemae]|uniref:hypothetical protein n=1 Tax=Rhizohabitans arisaemae TaxID=2720610 RepID=UPI0024B248DE|nr:hypothetical protein [Rhizohabitans arisaemae]
MSLRRRIATLSSVAALALSAVAFTPGTAMASPSNCSYQYGSSWVSGLCTSGTGKHFVVVRAQHYTGLILITGLCVPIGQTSTATVNWPIVYVGSSAC